MADDDFVTIGHMHDAVRAQMARDVLEQEDIPVILPGVEHRGMLGFHGAYLAIAIQVPRSRADEAAALLRALDDDEAEIVDDEAAALAAPLPPPPHERARS